MTIIKIRRRTRAGVITWHSMLVDDADAEQVRGWQPSLRGNGYATSSTIREYIHRLLMNAQRGDCTDHINGNRLDNRRSNLRIVPYKVNHANQRVLRSDNTNGLRGIRHGGLRYPRNPWIVQLSIDGKMTHVGCFSTLIEARQARQRAELSHFGELCPQVAS